MTPVANHRRQQILQLIKFIHRCYGTSLILDISDCIRSTQNHRQLWRYVYDNAATSHRY